MSRLRGALRVVLQIAVLSLFVVAGTALTSVLHLPVPGAVAGMALLLLALRLCVIRAEWLQDGAGFLFRHMLLFFVPAAVGAVQYPELLGAAGLRVVAVVAASTVLVMVSTGLAVEWAVSRRGADS